MVTSLKIQHLDSEWLAAQWSACVLSELKITRLSVFRFSCGVLGPHLESELTVNPDALSPLPPQSQPVVRGPGACRPWGLEVAGHSCLPASSREGRGELFRQNSRSWCGTLIFLTALGPRL